jgi:ectoine hydroxylase-related dioxygenase (phytanoyl-CoA dioxygenase family)
MSSINVDEFNERGFVVVRNFFKPEELEPLVDEIAAINTRVTKADHLSDGGLVFTSNIFHESDIFRKFITQQRLIDFLKPLMGEHIWVRWDQAVTKHPGAGVFHWHQDNAYNRLRKPHFQLWIALSESRAQNGGLWLAPGSHKRGLLPHDKVGNQARMTAEVGESECVDANMGDIILFSSLMLHRTGPNEADTSRIAYVAEYMPLSDYDFWLDPPYFVAARDGISQPHFSPFPPGFFSIENQMLYRDGVLHRIKDIAKNPSELGKRITDFAARLAAFIGT